MSDLDPSALVATMPFAVQSGVEISAASKDAVVGHIDWSEERCTIGGLMHGGALMTLADFARRGRRLPPPAGRCRHRHGHLQHLAAARPPRRPSHRHQHRDQRGPTVHHRPHRRRRRRRQAAHHHHAGPGRADLTVDRWAEGSAVVVVVVQSRAPVPGQGRGRRARQRWASSTSGSDPPGDSTGVAGECGEHHLALSRKPVVWRPEHGDGDDADDGDQREEQAVLDQRGAAVTPRNDAGPPVVGPCPGTPSKRQGHPSTYRLAVKLLRGPAVPRTDRPCGAAPAAEPSRSVVEA